MPEVLRHRNLCRVILLAWRDSYVKDVRKDIGALKKESITYVDDGINDFRNGLLGLMIFAVLLGWSCSYCYYAYTAVLYY